MMRSLYRLLLIFCIVTFLYTFASAQVPRLVHYQGELNTAEGNAFSGTTDITFSIYDRPLADNPIWSEVHENVEVENGTYGVMLGSKNPLKLSFYEYYLEANAAQLEAKSDRKMIVGSGYNYRLWFLFAAYTIVWLAIFLYILSLSRRQKKIIAELQALQAR